MLWIVHIIALFTIPLLLLITIPLHLILNSQNKKAKKLEMALEGIKQQNKQVDTVDDHSKFEQSEANSQNDIEAKKWETAKNYLSEVKDGLDYINSKINDSFLSKKIAEDALQDIFIQLGVSSITPNVLDNIVKRVHDYEGKDRQRSDREEKEFKEKQKVVDLRSEKYNTKNRDIEDFVTMVADGASINAIEIYFSGMNQDDLRNFINLPDTSDNYPLHKSIYSNRPEITEWLLKMGADPVAKNFWDKTPLEVSIGKENQKAETLVRKYLI